MGRGLYNGNISSMLVNIPQLGDAQLYGYSYDQLNRLTAMNAYTGLNTGNNSFVPVGSTNYKERVSYDGNGNILSYLRNRAGVGVDTSMDKLSYTYEYDGDGFLVKNRLKQVSDAVVSTPAGTGDLPTGQVSDNYGYDAIGNLIKDESEGIASGGIEWNVYGKISQITKTNSGVTTVIKYTYDATGNRIGKWVQVGADTPKQTAYVRDASGNVMAIYEKGNSEVNGGLLSQIEVPLYGSSRLGVWRPDREVETTGWELFDTDPMTGTGGIAGGWERGRVQFELSNHLGNVLVTISDARTAVDDGTYEVFTICHTCLPGIPCVPCFNEYDKQNSTPDGVVDYYLPQVLTANDYYPFGMGMPGRKFAEGNYRYGFNGQEKSAEIEPNGNSMTAEFWQYDARIGRRWNVDPRPSVSISVYAAFANNPIYNSDPLGDTTKYLNNEQIVSAIGIGVDLINNLSKNKTWWQGKDVSKDLTTAISAYWKENSSQYSFNAAAEFQKAVFEYYRGLNEIRFAGPVAWENFRYRFQDTQIDDATNILQTNATIYRYNGYGLGIITQGANLAMGLSAGAVGVSPGTGPRGPFVSNTQQQIVEASLKFSSYPGGNVQVSYNGQWLGNYTFSAAKGLELDLSIPANLQNRGLGTQIFAEGMRSTGASKFTATWIQSELYSTGSSVNLQVYRSALRTSTAEQAAWQTWSGRQAAAHGFKNVSVKNLPNGVEATFTK